MSTARPLTSMSPELVSRLLLVIEPAVPARHLRPAGTRAEAAGRILTALRRPLLIAIVLGVSTAMSATGRVTPSLVLSTTLCWSFVVVLQAVIALC